MIARVRELQNQNEKSKSAGALLLAPCSSLPRLNSLTADRLWRRRLLALGGSYASTLSPVALQLLVFSLWFNLVRLGAPPEAVTKYIEAGCQWFASD